MTSGGRAADGLEMEAIGCNCECCWGTGGNACSRTECQVEGRSMGLFVYVDMDPELKGK